MTEKNIFSLYGNFGLGDREKMFRNAVVNNESEILTKRDRVLNKTQSCGHIYYKNNIGDREKMFLSGVVNVQNGIPEDPTNKNENVVISKQNGTLNKTQSFDLINLKNNIGDREKMFMSGILNNQDGSPMTNGHSNREKFGRQNSYTEHGILNYESGEFKKQRTHSGASNEESVIVNGIAENHEENSNKMIENGNSIKNYKVLNKTQSCGNIFYRHNIGDREKMFISGILNVVPDNQTNNGNFKRQKLGRQKSYTEHGILNYKSGIFKKNISVSSMSSEDSLDLDGIAENRKTNSTQLKENGNSIKQNPILNKTQSCGNIFYRNHIGDREKMFLSGVVNNKNEIPENSRAESMRPRFARQNSYSEHGILNSGIYRKKSSFSSMSNEGSLDLNGSLENQKASSISATENKVTIKQNPVLNKTQSCGNFLHRNHIGDREKMFMSGVLNSTNKIPENRKTERRNRDFVRQYSYSEHGILNYESGVFKKRNVSSCSNEHCIDENDAPQQQKDENANSNNPNKSLNKTQSCGNIFFRNHIGDREKMFLSGVLNNTNEIPENRTKERRNRDFVRQNSYSEHGILNYESGVFKKRNISSGSNENSIEENDDALQKQKDENGNSNNPNKSLNKTQSCGNIFFRNHIGDREKMFLSGILNNKTAIPENKNPEIAKREFARQNSYTEHGILNYKRSASSDLNENYDAVKEFNGKTGIAISHLNETFEQSNESLSGVHEDVTHKNGPAKEMRPATSRIIARVKKSRSFALLSSSVPGYAAGVGNSERRVLVIYTGGTIGMVKNSDRVLEPIKGAFEGSTRTFPQLHDEPYWHKRFLNDDSGKANLVLPVVKDLDARIVYKIHENEVLLDSSNITVEDWITIAREIKLNYELYDGFVVLHGTDTLAYTASALSFMLENIGKPVVVTGSQIPIFEPRSDGADNFVSALIVAGGLNIPEVTVMFDSKLFRGNRTRKVSSYNFHAFDSPNCVPLAEFGIQIEVNNKAIFRPTKIEKCQLHENMSKNIGILRIFPSISAAVLHAFFQPPIEGVVLETYGSGNIPSNREDIFKEIELAVKRGVIIVNITQCTSGSVGAPQYETGRRIQACGVVSGYDMTPETALAKLSYVLSKDEWDREKKIEMMTSNIRGELTNINSLTLEDSSLIDALASSLKITSPKQLIEVTDRVFTALLLYAIDKEEEVTIQKMQELGAEVNSQNSEGKTPLHEAIYKENVNIVKYLLLRGANVHTKTRCGESPLLTAIQRDQQTIIRLLLNCGAHLASSDNLAVMEMLSLAARTGSVQRLESLKIAGVDFNLRDETGQTALHKAVLSSRPEVVKYLLDQGVERNVLDILKLSPLDYARRLEYEDMVRLLEDKHNDEEVTEEGLWM